jgi:hypothetical protein
MFSTISDGRSQRLRRRRKGRVVCEVEECGVDRVGANLRNAQPARRALQGRRNLRETSGGNGTGESVRTSVRLVRCAGT